MTQSLGKTHPRREASRLSLSARTKRDIVDLLGSRAVPDLRWLKGVTGKETSAILATVQETADLIGIEESMARMLDRSGRTNYAQFPAPLDLYVMTRLVRPLHVVESGVSSGLSSAHILLALRRNGRGQLHSIDLPRYQKAEKKARGDSSWSIPPGKDSGWAIPTRLKDEWDLRQGRSEDVLPSLVEELPVVGLFCHDSPWTPEHLSFEFDTIQPRLHSGSIVTGDDVDVNPKAARKLAAAFSTRVWPRGSSAGLVGLRVP